MTETLRVGLVGAGGIANAHIRGFRSVDGIEVVALWNRTRARAEQLAEAHGIRNARVFDDWRTMILEAELDVVSVVTAPQLRMGPVLLALEKGIHVLVEKPLAVNLSEAAKMVDAAHQAEVVTAVCFTWRYTPSALVARRIIQSGQLGQIRNCSSVWHFSAPPAVFTQDFRPFINKAHHGLGMLGENGSHQFDMINFLTGQVVTEIAGRMEWREPERPELRANLCHHLIGASETGVSITIEHTMAPGPVWRASQRRVYVEGSKGHIRVDGGLLDDGTVWVFLEGDSEARRVDPQGEEASMETQHTGLINDLVSCIRSPGPGTSRPDRLPTFGDGFQSLLAVLASLKADREKRWVSLSDLWLPGA
jgi:predicted dehydrogenase